MPICRLLCCALARERSGREYPAKTRPSSPNSKRAASRGHGRCSARGLAGTEPGNGWSLAGTEVEREEMAAGGSPVPRGTGEMTEAKS